MMARYERLLKSQGADANRRRIRWAGVSGAHALADRRDPGPESNEEQIKGNIRFVLSDERHLVFDKAQMRIALPICAECCS